AAQWRASVGTVVNFDKLLAVDVPAGKNTLVLAYKDRFLDFCLLISLGSLVAVLWYVGRDAFRWLKQQWDGWADLPTWPDEPPRTKEGAAEPAAPKEPGARGKEEASKPEHNVAEKPGD